MASFLHGEPGGFEGVLAGLARSLAEAKTDARKAVFDAFRSETTCASCLGSRLRPEARGVTVGGRAIHELTALSASAARDFLASLRFEPALDRVGPPLVAEVASRLRFLEEVGLGYLTLDRSAGHPLGR